MKSKGCQTLLIPGEERDLEAIIVRFYPSTGLLPALNNIDPLYNLMQRFRLESNEKVYHSRRIKLNKSLKRKTSLQTFILGSH
jgi:hypothetical protein